MYDDTPQDSGARPDRRGRLRIAPARTARDRNRRGDLDGPAACDSGLPPRDVRAREHRRLGRRRHRPRPPGRARRARRRAPARRAPTAASRRSAPPLVKSPKPGLRFQRKDTEQYHVCLGALGISSSDRRRFVASILDAVLGGSASSRLFQEIREKRGMAYSVYTLRVAVHGHRADRRVPRNARGQPRRRARDRRRADRGDRGRRAVGQRARPREGEPQGARPALDGVDLDAHEPARQVDRHRLRDPVARAGDGGGGRRRARLGVRAAPPCCSRRNASRSRGSARARSGSSRRRSASLRRWRARHEGPAQRPRAGEVGTVLGPALEAAGHVLVATVGEAEAMVDFTVPAAVDPERDCARSRRASRRSSARRAGTRPTSTLPRVPRACRSSTPRTSRSGPC